jgi:hypothetical protein
MTAAGDTFWNASPAVNGIQSVVPDLFSDSRQILPSQRLPPIKLPMITIVPTVSFGSPQQPEVALSQIPAPTAAGMRIHASVFMMFGGYGTHPGS